MLFFYTWVAKVKWGNSKPIRVNYAHSLSLRQNNTEPAEYQTKKLLAEWDVWNDQAAAAYICLCITITKLSETEKLNVRSCWSWMLRASIKTENLMCWKVADSYRPSHIVNDEYADFLFSILLYRLLYIVSFQMA